MDRHAIHELNSTILQASTFTQDQKQRGRRQAVRALQRQERRVLPRQAVRALQRQEERARVRWDRKKINIVRGWTDSEYEVGSARNSRINSTILQALTFIRDQNEVRVKQYWPSSVKKNEVRVKQYGLSSVKMNEVFHFKKNEVFRVQKNELGNAEIGKNRHFKRFGPIPSTRLDRHAFTN